MVLSRVVVLTILLFSSTPILALGIPEDPLESFGWKTMYHLYFKDQPVVFDELLEVIIPSNAEDSMRVPVAVRFDELAGEVEKILVFADYNPIPKVLEYYPKAAAPFIAFGMRVQQSTPIRAAALTHDGTWHLAGAWVNAQGGGCTMPSATRSTIDDTMIGQVDAGLFPGLDGQRLKFRVIHPMDTGLIAGMPSFYVEELRVEDDQGQEMALLKTFEPLSESPVLSLDLRGESSFYTISGRDNNGLRIEATVQ